MCDVSFGATFPFVFTFLFFIRIVEVMCLTLGSRCVYIIVKSALFLLISPESFRSYYSARLYSDVIRNVPVDELHPQARNIMLKSRSISDILAQRNHVLSIASAIFLNFFHQCVHEYFFLKKSKFWHALFNHAICLG